MQPSEGPSDPIVNYPAINRVTHEHNASEAFQMLGQMRHTLERAQSHLYETLPLAFKYIDDGAIQGFAFSAGLVSVLSRIVSHTEAVVHGTLRPDAGAADVAELLDMEARHALHCALPSSPHSEHQTIVRTAIARCWIRYWLGEDRTKPGWYPRDDWFYTMTRRDETIEQRIRRMEDDEDGRGERRERAAGVLERASRLLTGSGWAKGAAAMHEDGSRCWPAAPCAMAWSAYGAVEHEARLEYPHGRRAWRPVVDQAVRTVSTLSGVALGDERTCQALCDWNDEETTTLDEVTDLFARAIAELRDMTSDTP